MMQDEDTPVVIDPPEIDPSNPDPSLMETASELQAIVEDDSNGS